MPPACWFLTRAVVAADGARRPADAAEACSTAAGSFADRRTGFTLTPQAEQRHARTVGMDDRRRHLIGVGLVAAVALVMAVATVLAFRNMASAIANIGTRGAEPSGLASWAPTALVAVAAVAARFGLERVQPDQSASLSLDERVNELAESLRASSGFIDEMEAEIAARTRLLGQAREDVERARREVDETRALARLEPNARTAVQAVLRGELRVSDRRGWCRDSVMLVAGIFVTKLFDVAVRAIS